MFSSVAQGLVFVYLALIVFGLVVAVLWILVPFAVFGIKPLLRQLVYHLQAVEKQNGLLLSELRNLRQAPQSVGDKPVVIDCGRQPARGSD